MKIKQSPDDFVVEELTHVTPSGHGDFALYRLEKRGWATIDAIQTVRRRWDVDYRRVGYGGLKDRHAATTQHFSIYHGPQRDLTHDGFAVHYLGRVTAPFGSHDIAANRFRVVVRDLDPALEPGVISAAGEVQRAGLPNYFDDQRFGSAVVAADGTVEFPARLMILGQWGDALRTALASHYEYDHAEQKAEKELLRRMWGDWGPLKDALPRGHARSLVDYLRVHPTDLRGAVARLRPELRGLYLAAYQSFVWNRILAAWLRRHVPADALTTMPTRVGGWPVPRRLDPEQLAGLGRLRLPLPSARQKPAAGDEWAELAAEALADQGFPLDQMKLRGLREPFFSKGLRDAWCKPAGLTFSVIADGRNVGRRALTLSFDLPRGSYATLVVKRACGSAAAGLSEMSSELD